MVVGLRLGVVVVDVKWKDGTEEVVRANTWIWRRIGNMEYSKCEAKNYTLSPQSNDDARSSKSAFVGKELSKDEIDTRLILTIFLFFYCS